MGLECVYGPLHYVSPVHARRDEPVSHSPFFSRQLIVFLAALVVKGLEVYKEVLILQSLHDDAVGIKAVDIFWGHKGLDEDDVGGVLGNHDVLVSAPCSGGEAACVVCVDLAMMHCFYVETIDAVIW